LSLNLRELELKAPERVVKLNWLVQSCWKQSWYPIANRKMTAILSEKFDYKVS